MANPEHLKILQQGIRPWNRWRNEHPDIQPDLRRTDMTGSSLRNRNLRGVDLREANLSSAGLSHGRLSKANLRKANLTKADLKAVDLSGADLREADLQNAVLNEAQLLGADLSGANLAYANLRGAKAMTTDFSGANLYRVIFCEANLNRANFNRAYLYNVDLWRANAKETNFEDADLRYCDLNQTNFKGAMLTGIRLYGTGRDDWIIKDINCHYLYWDEEGKQRSPKDRDLEPGEFERLYASLPTIEYIFENGMTPLDPLIMDRVVEAIRERRPDLDIKIDSINARGLAPSIKFTIQHEKHKKQALKEVKKEYEIKQTQLEGKLEEINKHIKNLIDRPNTINIINAPQAKYLAIDGSTLNIQETSNYYAFELNKAIEQEPEESESFTKIAKKAALDIVGNVIKDIAKGQVKEAAKQIIELGKDLGPLFVKMAPIAYEFFKNIVA